jgi:O-antigen/teichoic acid export membrane protein
MLADIAGNLFLLVLIAALSATGGSVLLVIVIYLASNLVKAVAGLFFVRSYVTLGLDFDAGLAKTLLSLAWPLGLTAVFIQVIANLDKQIVALSSYRESLGINASHAVGIYGLAYRVFDFAIAFPAFVTNSTFPALVEKARSGGSDLRRVIKKIFVVLIGVGLIGSLATLFAAPLLVPIFGDYGQAVISLRLLALGIPIFFVTSLGFALLIVLKKEKLLPFIYGFAVLFNFAANFYFVPRFGYNAAAIITGVTELLVLLIMAVLISNFLTSKNEGN